MKTIIIVSVIFMLSACAARSPIIDTKGVSMDRYYSDMAECRKYADQINTGTNTIVGAGVGAGIGAAVGAIVGAFFGSPGQTAAFGAALGGVGGGTRGAGNSWAAKRQIINNCMAGRGYKVLY